jgi:alkylation response protein AidB-like acyl-CoA dehydrogenase
MNLALNDEQQDFQKSTRDFVDKEVVPYRAEWGRLESVDLAIVPELGELGFFGLTIPEQYGDIGCVARTRTPGPSPF